VNAKKIKRLTDPFFQSHGFTRKGNLYYKIKDLLVFCIVFEPVNGTLYCNYCMTPLYMPSEDLYLTYGTRVETFTRYRLPPLDMSQSDETCAAWVRSLTDLLDRRILPFFARIDTPEHLARFLKRGYRWVKRYFFCTKEQYCYLRAYTAFALGDDRRAEASIRASLRELDCTSPYPYTESYKAMRRKEFDSIRDLLGVSPADRNHYLQSIISETRSHLFPDTESIVQ
jgi:hypothetical protein